jgi:hypothetical protein
VIYCLLSIAMIAFPDSVLDLGEDGTISAPLLAMGMIALLEAPLRLACVVLFLIWLHRAYSNLSPLKARNLEFSPGWAVGWWFVPFANIVKPFQIVREVYNESDPDFDVESGFLHLPGGTPEIIAVWWGTFLLSGLAHRIADAFYGKGDLPSSEYFPVVFIVAGLLSAISAGAAIFLVLHITKRQEARAAKIDTHRGVTDTPPPPTFAYSQ